MISLREGSSSSTATKTNGRAARSCNRCRRLKKVCTGTAPCQRCQVASTECSYDKATAPAPVPSAASLAGFMQRIEARLEELSATITESSERLRRLELAASGDLGSNAPFTNSHTAPPSPQGYDNEPVNHLLDDEIGELPDHRLHLPAQALVDAAATMKGLQSGILENLGQNYTRADPDIVEKRLLTESQAFACVREFLTDMYEFCAVLHPQVDTYETIKQSNTFLFNTVVYLGARAMNDTKILDVAREEARCRWQSIAGEPPTVETVQALALRACWHDDSYITSGLAMRMALYLRWHLLTTRYSRDAWSSSDESMRPRVKELRTWLIVQFLDFKHSVSTDRPLQIQEKESARMAETADYLLLSPFCVPSDARAVANLLLCIRQRGFIKVVREKRLDWAVDKFFEESQKEIETWYSHYDTTLVARGYGPQSWPRLSHRRHFFDGRVQLATMLYRQTLLRLDNERSAKARKFAFENAQGSIRTVLNSAAYSASIRHSGYSTRVDLTFACLLLLKISKVDQTFPRSALIEDVTSIANLLRDSPGSSKQEELLRFALARSDESPVAPAGTVPFTFGDLSTPFGGNTTPTPYDPSWLSLDTWLTDLSSSIDVEPYGTIDPQQMDSRTLNGTNTGFWQGT